MCRINDAVGVRNREALQFRANIELCGVESVVSQGSVGHMNNNKEETEVNKVGCGGASEYILSICEKSRALAAFFRALDLQTSKTWGR